MVGYRGDDLDLRTPQATPGDFAIHEPVEPFIVASRPRPTAGASRSAPIWVDATLLDCCNHAYDVASAHRAAEVRLEHLIYALTGIEEAARVLEMRGVHIASLRREAATTIATEIPAVQGNGKTNPRRAQPVEEALRHAAAVAYRRQAPATVNDLIYALLDSGMEAATLLRGLPAATARPAEAALDVDALHTRHRNGGPAAAQTPRGVLADFAATSQHSRIDAIEQSLRTLTQDLANERKILSGVLQDLQRELMAQREDTTRLGGITQDRIQTVFGDRMQGLEQAFLSARAPGADLTDRLGLLERALQGEISVTRSAVEALAEKPGLDLAPLLLRLETIEAAAGAERERVRTTEEALSNGIQALTASVERQPSVVAEQLDAANASRDTQHAATLDAFAETHRRLAALEEALNAHVARAEAATTAAAQERADLRALLERIAERSEDGFARLSETITQDLSEVHDGLARVHSDHHALATTLDSEAEGASNAFAALADRIGNLERASAKPVEMLEALSTTVDKMHKVTVEKYYRRNRFWYWLFGTDDWLAASWPSQSARIAEELRAIKR
jgi:hypothetical protein